jgi:tetratricopeptide (TPR) repeat protein
VLSVDLFERGTVGRTLTASLIADTAWLGTEPAMNAALEVLATDPVFTDTVDGDLMAILLDDADQLAVDGRADRGVALARLTAKLQSPTQTWVLARLAGVLLRAGRPVEAEQVVSELPAEAAAATGARDIAALSLYEQGRYDEAATIFLDGATGARTEGRPEAEWDLLTNAVACYMALDDPVAALSLLVDRVEPVAVALGDAWRLSKTCGDLGNVQTGLGKDEPARDSFAKALAAARTAGRDQDQSDWLGNLGTLALRAGDVDAALAYYRPALAISRRTGDIRSLIIDLANLARAYAADQRWDEASAHQIEAVRTAEQHGDPELSRAQRQRLRDLYVHLGHWRKAVAVDANTGPSPPPTRPTGRCVRSVGGDPKITESEESFVTEVQRLVTQRKFAAAQTRIEAYLEAQPDSAVAYGELGLVLNEAGEYAASLEAYDKALALAPRWANLHRNALNSWRGLGDLDTPRRRYEQAVADNPFDAASRIALALLYGIEGRFDDAVREGRESVRLDPDSTGVRYTACEIIAQAAIATLPVDWHGAWAMFEEVLADYRALADMPGAIRADALTRLGEDGLTMAVKSGTANPTPLGAVIGDQEAWLIGAAVAAFGEAAKLAPDRRRPQAGLAAAQELMNISPDPDTRLSYAQGLADADAEDQAITALQCAIDEYPDTAELHYQLGMLWARTAQGSSDGLVRAKDCLTEALRIDRHDDRYRAALEHVTALIEARH